MVRAETHKNYTKQQLEDLSKDSLIDLYLNQQTQLTELDKKMQLILEQMVTSNRARFGRSSEKIPAEGQIRFAEVDGTIVFFNEAEAVNDTESPGTSDEESPDASDETDKEPQDGKKKNKPPVKTKGQKEQALSQLPTRRVDHDIPVDELEKLFGKDGWKRLPDEVYRRLEFIPAKVEVEEHHVAVYAAKDESHMEKAKHPAYLLRNSLVTPSLLAAIINGKYVNAVPLYRLEKEFERYGIPVTRQNMANWVIQGSERYLSIFYDYLHQKLYDFHVIQADETRVEVTKDGRSAGAMSWMWVYRTGSMYEDRAVVLYDYQKDRKTDHPLEFLKGFSGICETDGYQVYHKIEGMKEDLKIAGCWAHARRKFYDAEQTVPKKIRNKCTAHLALRQIQAIYREEKHLKGLPPDERLELRKRCVKPLVDAYFAWVKQEAVGTLEGGILWKAFQYSMNQEKYLRVFLEDGEVPMDNNASLSERYTYPHLFEKIST
ncbi:MAG: IS66 family transposase, partial [Lachnospiraceae bacterium]|nr:IS66 family transposase [Lachnospiraceae bacterium]